MTLKEILSNIISKSNQLSNEIDNSYDTIFPVGFVYISFENVSPSALFGGAWERLKDYFPRFSNNTLTGGSNTHTITESQLPSHSHHDLMWLEGTENYFGANNSGSGRWRFTQWASGASQAYFYTNRVGEGRSHANMPKYQNLYAWKRIELSHISNDIPSTYERLQYLQSNGNQYINTGVTITGSPLTLRGKVELTVDTTDEKDFFGNLSSSATNSQYAFVCGTRYTHQWYHWGGSVFSVASYQIGVPYNVEYTYFDTGGREFTIDGVKYVSSESNYYMFNTNSFPIGLFSGAGDRLYDASSVKLYNAQIIISGITVRNFVPCRRISDSALGMYDTITGNFYTNLGSGSFTYA